MLIENVNSIGIINTEKKLTNDECVNITNEKKWKRNCPKCGKEVLHTSKYTMIYALNKPCKDCSHIGLYYKEKLIDPKDLIRNCPVCGIEIQYKYKSSKRRGDREKRMCIHCVGNNAIKYRLTFSNETKEKIGQHRRGKTYKELGIICDLIKRGETISKMKKGVPFTEEHCLSLRNARIKWLKNHGFVFPTFNRNACEYLDKLNKEKGWNLQHALNGGEYFILGYWVDGYDKEKNIVVEYDEPFHNKPCRMLKDKKRMEEIKRSLQCRFLRYDVLQNKLKEY